MPPLTFAYTHVKRLDGTTPPKEFPGFEGFDDTIRKIAASPPHSLDDALTELFDVNADALPDVLVTAPGLFGGAHAVFFNAAGGKKDAFGAATLMTVAAVPGLPANEAIDSGVLTFKNPNVVPLDLDGDGIANLVHMPQYKRPVLFQPQRLGQTWQWVGRVAQGADSLNPKIDLTNHVPDVKVGDVDSDGLVDVIFGGATGLQTFFSLGRYPGGDGRFGTGAWTGASTADLSPSPATGCVPWSATPVRLSDPDVRLADMNGDGLVDIVRVRKGDVRYWPGRGNGFWGTGNRDDCKQGIAQDRHLAMTDSPVFPGTDDARLMLGDVSGDGLADLVQVRFEGVDVWVNIDGTSWTPRHILAGAPVSSVQNRVRLVDVNGSGTPDVVWGDGFNYRYADLLGGARPRLLARAANGLGKTVDFSYGTSTDEMLAAEVAGKPWRKMPMVVHVVKRITVSDNLDKVGRPAGVQVTELSYTDPVYDARQREFRGFASATERHLGDAWSPSSATDSQFLLGECAEEQTPGQCDPQNGWMGNPREALKGLPVVTETRDDAGVYLSTTHHTYRLRRLYVGLDGREVRHAFVSRSDDYTYDTSAFDHTEAAATIDDVERELAPGSPMVDATRAVKLRATSGRARVTKRATVDPFGNAVDATNDGCVEGCVVPDEAITVHTRSALPPGDASGWLWRTVETYTTGSKNPTEKRAHGWTAFDLRGQPTRSWSELAGTLPLDRFHAGGGAVAPAPAEASSDGLTAASEIDYDAFGNPVAHRGPNGRCGALAYDAAFAQLVERETAFVGPVVSACGTRELATLADYDRGLAAPRRVVGPNGETTRMDSDQFGRVLRTWDPDPVVPGGVAGAPAATYEYGIPANWETQPYVVVHARARDGNTPDDPSDYHETWTYADGLGRVIVSLSEADPSAGDGGGWIAGSMTDRCKKGLSIRAYLATFWDGDPASFPLATLPTTKHTEQRYDAFGRVTAGYATDHSMVVRNAYHALSQDVWDAGHVGPGANSDVFSSAARDGHGRVVVATERARVGGPVEAREVRTDYLPTGQAYRITRVRVGQSDPPVVRWIRYDSLGRMVLNAEPNTTRGFNPNPSTDISQIKAWRYAYNDSGALVGTSDARGCGANYHYDAGGRLVAEDFSPCLVSHAPYTAPSLATGDGTEAFYRHDVVDPDALGSTAVDCAPSPFFLAGRLASVASLGSKTSPSYDGQGRVTCVTRRMAKPGVTTATLSDRYAPRWYAQASSYDGAGRPVRESTGARVAELQGQSFESAVSTSYSRRGVMKAIGSTYGALVAGRVLDANGLLESITYGDLAATRTEYLYDDRIRVRSVQTYRGPPALWGGPSGPYTPPPSGVPSTLQLVLQDYDFSYDAADNPIDIRDLRIADEWPEGSKPVTRAIEYDDLYRATRVTYQIAGGSDTWVSPFAAENLDQNPDPRRAKPTPQVSFARRLLEQRYDYDWLGNTTRTTDDADGFYERSLGTVTNGAAAAGPHQLKAATNRSSSPKTPSREGDLDAAYDDAGNLVALVVRRDGPCLPAAASCWQRYAYEWDEVGRLASARRWDLTVAERASHATIGSAVPPRTPDTELRHAYDASDERTLKTAIDGTASAVHTVYVFDSLELRRAAWGGTGAEADYALDSATEVPYLTSGGARLARVVYGQEDLPTASAGRQHVFFELTDHLGSTAVTVDKETSELVEAATYQAYGATDSDYRPDRWKSFREDYRFTGKEEDVEVGLQYFGKRYYAPSLGRWASADPLTVHSLGSDPNAYAYVHGRPLIAVDPAGEMGILIPFIIAAVVGGAFNAGYNIVHQSKYNPGPMDWGSVGISFGTGALGGAVAPLFGPTLPGMMAGGALGSALTGIGERGLQTWHEGGTRQEARENAFDLSAIATSAAVGAAAGAVSWGIGRLLFPVGGQVAREAPPAGGGPKGAQPLDLPDWAKTPQYTSAPVHAPSKTLSGVDIAGVVGERPPVVPDSYLPPRAPAAPRAAAPPPAAMPQPAPKAGVPFTSDCPLGCKALGQGSEAGGQVPTVGGRAPINSQWAGKVHPSGVYYTQRGFPDFSPFAKARVEVEGLTGNYAKDAAMANRAVGLKSTPKGYVWHHVEDARTMLLVPQGVHEAARHTGGAAIIRNSR
jgi:RHS repeat-associated protein